MGAWGAQRLRRSQFGTRGGLHGRPCSAHPPRLPDRPNTDNGCDVASHLLQVLFNGLVIALLQCFAHQFWFSVMVRTAHARRAKQRPFQNSLLSIERYHRLQGLAPCMRTVRRSALGDARRHVIQLSNRSFRKIGKRNMCMPGQLNFWKGKLHLH